MCKKRKKEEFSPVESFSKSLAIPFDLGYDILENSIDLVIDNEIVKSIPIVKGIVAAKDIVVSVYQRHEIKKLIAFFQKLNNHAEEPEIIKMRKRIFEDADYLRKEAELALVVLEKTIEVEKSHLIANVFYLYVKEELTYSEYTELVLVINQIYMLDTQVLLKVSNGNPKQVENKDLAALNRLEGSGVISQCIIDGNGLCYNHYQMTQTGKNFVKIIKM